MITHNKKKKQQEQSQLFAPDESIDFTPRASFRFSDNQLDVEELLFDEENDGFQVVKVTDTSKFAVQPSIAELVNSKHAFTDRESWALKAGVRLRPQMTWLEQEKAKLRSEIAARKSIIDPFDVAPNSPSATKPCFTLEEESTECSHGDEFYLSSPRRSSLAMSPGKSDRRKSTNPSHKLATATVLSQPMAPAEENTADLVRANSSAIRTRRHSRRHTIGRQVESRASEHVSILNPSVGYDKISAKALSLHGRDITLSPASPKASKILTTETNTRPRDHGAMPHCSPLQATPKKCMRQRRVSAPTTKSPSLTVNHGKKIRPVSKPSADRSESTATTHESSGSSVSLAEVEIHVPTAAEVSSKATTTTTNTVKSIVGSSTRHSAHRQHRSESLPPQPRAKSLPPQPRETTPGGPRQPRRSHQRSLSPRRCSKRTSTCKTNNINELEKKDDKDQGTLPLPSKNNNNINELEKKDDKDQVPPSPRRKNNNNNELEKKDDKDQVPPPPSKNNNNNNELEKMDNKDQVPPPPPSSRSPTRASRKVLKSPSHHPLKRVSLTSHLAKPAQATTLDPTSQETRTVVSSSLHSESGTRSVRFSPSTHRRHLRNGRKVRSASLSFICAVGGGGGQEPPPPPPLSLTKPLAPRTQTV